MVNQRYTSFTKYIIFNLLDWYPNGQPLSPYLKKQEQHSNNGKNMLEQLEKQVFFLFYRVCA